MTMTKYEPKTTDLERNQAIECSNSGDTYHCDSILNDLTHAESCLRERDAEIERLNVRLVQALKTIATLDGQISHSELFSLNSKRFPTQEPDHAN